MIFAGCSRQGEHSMNPSQLALSPNASHELRFHSLSAERRGYAFPCDAAGHVNMNTLSDRARNNYLYARIGIGREFAVPSVELASAG